MRKLPLCQVEDDELERLLLQYKSTSKQDAELEVTLYKKIRYEGFSTMEIARDEHLSRPSVYRKIKKVDQYIERMTKKNNG